MPHLSRHALTMPSASRSDRDPTAAPPLAARLRNATQVLHREVERAPLIVQWLRGTLPRPAYVALLRQLHAWYDALESSLATASAADPRLAALPWPPLQRAAALAADLGALAGDQWAALPLLPTAAQRAAMLREAGRRGDVATLIAWAYVRYLGDLSGGQRLATVAAPWHRAAGDAEGPAFYDFSRAGDARTLAAELRRGLDALPLTPAEQDAVEAAALEAFRAHATLFEALAVALPASQPAAALPP